MTKTATQACYWIIGRDNAGQQPAMAIETYAKGGEPVTMQTFEAYSLGKAIEWARTQGVPHDKVYHDTDSTDCFADA